MKDYAAMSDQQINQLVGCKIGELQIGARSACCIGSDGNVLVLKGGMWQVFDPCNNPADAWPIILQSKISIFALDDDDWGARGYNCIIRSINHNPLRAAMELFLKMKESEND